MVAFVLSLGRKLFPWWSSGTCGRVPVLPSSLPRLVQSDSQQRLCPFASLGLSQWSVILVAIVSEETHFSGQKWLWRCKISWYGHAFRCIAAGGRR